MKRVFILVAFISLILFPNFSYAAMKGFVKPYFSTGIKSQTDVIDDRDLSGNFQFYRYGIGGDLKMEDKLLINVAYENYFKDFSGVNISDVNTKFYKTGIGYLLLKGKENSLDLDLDFSMRNKRYNNSPQIDYDQFRFDADIDYTFLENYSLSLSSGINDYEYIKDSGLDVLKTYVKIAPEAKFFEKKLELSGYYRIRWLDYKDNNKGKSENIYLGSAVVNLDPPLLYKIKGDVETGSENTQDTEDREDSLRYKYHRWDVVTYHKLNKSLKTQVEYGQKERDYVTDTNDYRNWYIKNKSSFKILEKEYFDLNLLEEYEYKDAVFIKIDTKSYIKNKITTGLSFSKWGKWSFDPEFSFTDYNYAPGSTSDQKTYDIKASASKYIMKDLLLEGGYSYKWKDYKYKPDEQQWAANLSCTIKF